MGDVLKNDDFLDVTIMTINVEGAFEESITHLMLKWHEVFSWIHKGCANTNYAQKSKLLDNRGPTLFPEKGWCFSTNH